MRYLGILGLVAAAAIAGCESPQTVVNEPTDLPGTSNAEGSALLTKDVLNAIMMLETANYPACESRTLADTRILEEVEGGTFSPSGVLLTGSWLEAWTIDRCGTPVTYKVIFVADGAEGTYFGISSP